MVPANITATVLLMAPPLQHHAPCCVAGTSVRLSRGASRVDNTTPCLGGTAGGAKASL